MAPVLRYTAVLILLHTPLALKAQAVRTDTLKLHQADSTYHLSSEFLRQNSETVFFDGTLPLGRDTFYILDERFGILTILPALNALIRGDSSSHFLVVRYSTIPVSFQKEYFLKTVTIRTDTAGSETKTLAPSSSSGFSVDDLFGPSMQKSGSLTRGFTIASNRDLTLNSGFRMQMSGQLSREVDVVAVLTDENTPLQPEGTTQTLQEVDKVFVDINHPSARATLGDFNEEMDQSTGGEFARFSRKLQGAKGTVVSDGLLGGTSSSSVSVAGGSARGKYRTNEFRGREGNQGPYRLTGSAGERQIIVVAGSERVYLDGIQMVRGELSDYTVDYASAEITFTARRLITSVSRIVVDFEYTDRHYQRNFFSAGTSSRLLNESIRVNALFMQETDDVEDPIDVTLDEEIRSILAQSGADPLKASVSGIQFAGRDSVTNVPRGQYVLRDTVISGKAYAIAVYAPGDSLALYSVSFSSVEGMPPDSAGYERIGLGHFRFAGIGQGSYLPLKTIPLPGLHRFFDVNADVALTRNLTVSGEFAASRFDRNRLSRIDDAQSNDEAVKLGIRFNPRVLTIGGIVLRDVDLSYSERFVGGRFVSPDRVNDVEFGRKWNFDSLPAGDERLRVATLSVRPIQAIAVGAEYGFLQRPGGFGSERLRANATAEDSSLGRGSYQIESIRNTDPVSVLESEWLRHGGQAEYRLGGLSPGVRLVSEDRRIARSGGDSLTIGSFRFVEWAPGIRMEEFLGMKASAEVQLRTDDSSLAGTFRKASTSVTQLYTWELREWRDLAASVAVSARKTRFTEAFRSRANSNSDVVMVRSLARYSPLQHSVETDAFYEFSNQRSARLERVYIRVPQGEGNYRYRGDRNGNNLADDDEFELTRFDGEYIVLFLPGETLYPVADLKASIRLRLQPIRILDRSSAIGALLAPLSTETYFRIDERSSDPKTANIYLLNVSSFLDPEHTISGSQLFTQDIHVFENQTSFSSRIRFVQRKGLIQLISTTEHSYMRERAIRIRTQLIPELANQTELTNRLDQVAATAPGPRDRDLLSYFASSDFAYRPERDVEIGFRFQFDHVTDRFGDQDAVADGNDQSIRVVYSIPGKGQVRAEVTREEVVLSRPSADPGRNYPYEFTQGRTFGKSYLWSANFEYRVTRNIQVTVQYGGRSQSNGTPVHLARAEAKAFF